MLCFRAKTAASGDLSGLGFQHARSGWAIMGGSHAGAARTDLDALHVEHTGQPGELPHQSAQEREVGHRELE